MRLVTAIAENENLVARGVYSYLLNQQPTGVTESWSIHQLPNGTARVRVERDARSFGTTILLEAVSETPEQLCRLHRFEVQFFSERNEATADVRAVYVFANQSVDITRSVNGLSEMEHLELPPGTIISPLMRVFLGQTILEVAARGQGESAPVLVPFLENPNDAGRLLRPTFDERCAWELGQESREIAGRFAPTRCFRYLSKQYDEQSKFWLNENGLLVQYRFHQREDQIWDTQLTELVRHY